jgi:hypothetical protein
MKKFGILKTKLLTKLTESYAKENKAEIKNILTIIKENKSFKEMYLFYEEIENKYFEDKEIAKLYVEGLSTYFGEPIGNWGKLNMICESLNSKLNDVQIETNVLYESLDILSEKDSLSNIEKKVIAKKKLIEHLTTKKESDKTETAPLVNNESLLNAILANNFNVLYSNTLNEEQKKELKNILSMSYDDLVTKTNELQESILNQVDSIMTESSDLDMKNKLDDVKKEVNEISPSRYNYYRLTELKNGLN